MISFFPPPHFLNSPTSFPTTHPLFLSQKKGPPKKSDTLPIIMKPTLSNLRHSLSRAAKAAIEFPHYIIEVITGILLGDTTLKKDKRNPKGNARLQVQQKDCSFVEFLWNLCSTSGIVGALPYTIQRYDSRTGKTYTVVSLPLLFPSLLPSLIPGTVLSTGRTSKFFRIILLTY
jgi:hypothetical protein